MSEYNNFFSPVGRSPGFAITYLLPRLGLDAPLIELERRKHRLRFLFG